MSFVIEKNENKPFVQAPAGRYQAVCVDVVDEGLHANPFKEGAMERKISISFQINKLNDEGRRFLISKWFTFSLHSKAALAQFACDWLETPYEQLPSPFNIEDLIGVNARLRIVQEPKKNNPNEMRSIIKAIEPWFEADGPFMAPLDFKRRVERDNYTAPSDEQLQQMVGQPAQRTQAEPDPRLNNNPKPNHARTILQQDDNAQTGDIFEDNPVPTNDYGKI